MFPQGPGPWLDPHSSPVDTEPAHGREELSVELGPEEFKRGHLLGVGALPPGNSSGGFLLRSLLGTQ